MVENKQTNKQMAFCCYQNFSSISIFTATQKIKNWKGTIFLVYVNQQQPWGQKEQLDIE